MHSCDRSYNVPTWLLRMIPIIIPLHPSGGRFGKNEELRYALRSLERHFTEPFKLVIVGRYLPAWLKGAELIECRHGLKSALKLAAEHYPEGFFWVYDDNVLLADRTAEEMKITPGKRKWGDPETGWSRDLESIRTRLEGEGIEPIDYSRPHGPYWFDKAMVDQGFEDWPGMKGKFPWESWILSKWKWPWISGVTKQLYGDFSPPAEHHVYLNYNEAGTTVELREWLHARFPLASRFEREVPKVSTSGVEVHTIRFGDAWWISACGDSLDDWCRRHGHGLRVWDKAAIHPRYPTAKFCVLDMLESFLAGTNQWCFYVDADVYVTDDAPTFPDMPGIRGMVIRPDQPSGATPGFPKFCEKHFPEQAGMANGWKYRNAGVWVCDRQAAAEMLRVAEEPYINAWQEQHQWNWWLVRAAAAGMAVTTLPDEWNRFGLEQGQAHFWHLAGKNKAEMFRKVRESLGILEPLCATIDGAESLEALVEACAIEGGDMMSIPEEEAESHPRLNAALTVIPEIDNLCNGAIGHLLRCLEFGKWQRLIIRSTPGAQPGRRRPRRTGQPFPYDVEHAGILTGSPLRRVALDGKTYLVYER
ncbi:hypothetical protein JIN84_13000 [Luteolibacter yonseiensis]|uniref:Uncharacterized protein n=1 Tax=Luteolibacter yonseiensis TaxID=1144680 RepID=A0A934R446_9BACT|nr:hypothetical protein [Luteolibacter yonseiensis]MBK1816537.1 hypothetical protein [Luteolibacter yonseiensis]